MVFLIGMRINQPLRPNLWASGISGDAGHAGRAVGIWHQTYLAERAETVYSGMVLSGLAAATAAVPVARRGETARERLAA